jgi:phosphoribosylglycinamide formyltransferase-1
MYGMNVHKAVREAGESVSGMTIHYVNNHYDEGGIIRQESVNLNENDSAEEIARKVLELEHRYFAPTIEQLLKNLS